MKSKIKEAFKKIGEESIVNGYMTRLNVIINASRQCDKFDEVCDALDHFMVDILEIFEDKCPASDQSQS